jgi:hypothetical protein
VENSKWGRGKGGDVVFSELGGENVTSLWMIGSKESLLNSFGFSCFVFGGARVWTPLLTLARYMCYHLSHTLSPFLI